MLGNQLYYNFWMFLFLICGHYYLTLCNGDEADSVVDNLETCLNNFKIPAAGDCDSGKMTSAINDLIAKHGLSKSSKLENNLKTAVHSVKVTLAERKNLASMECIKNAVCSAGKCDCGSSSDCGIQIQDKNATCNVQFNDLIKKLSSGHHTTSTVSTVITLRQNTNHIDGVTLPNEEIERLSQITFEAFQVLENCLQNFGIPDGKLCDQEIIEEANAKFVQVQRVAEEDVEKIPLAARITHASLRCLTDSSCEFGECKCVEDRVLCKNIIQDPNTNCERANFNYVIADAALTGKKNLTDEGPDPLEVLGNSATGNWDKWRNGFGIKMFEVLVVLTAEAFRY